MSDKHSREPIKHTCPDIDKYIKYIKWEIVADRDLQNMNEKDLLDAASSMASKLDDCIGYLEKLRKSNDTLREWGISEADKVDNLQNYVEEFDSKNSEN